MILKGPFAGPFMFRLSEVNKLGSNYNIVAYYLGDNTRYIIQIYDTEITIRSPHSVLGMMKEDYTIDEREGEEYITTSVDSQRRHLFKFDFKSLIMEERIYSRE